jgi:2-polyprenyl-6-hydroxyphenyl methylase/3-demethylubiquinone-9 3-methyltransferase
VIQYALMRISPRFVRWLRTRALIDWKRLSRRLPSSGRLLDVGCGIGVLDYAIGRDNPDLRVVGIDISEDSIARAREHHALPNVSFAAKSLQSVDGEFDCVLFVDVFHHVPPAQHEGLLRAARERLSPNGYVLIKEIERRRGAISLFFDKVISRCPEVWLMNRNELEDVVRRHLRVRSSEAKWRFPFPHYYITAGREDGNAASAAGER